MHHYAPCFMSPPRYIFVRGGLHVQDMAAALFRDAFSSFNALMYLVVAALLGAEIVLVIAPIVISVRYAPPRHH